MREREEVEQRGDFFRTATSMIEDLNSVAADLHRYLEDEPPDTLWKRYHKGDRSIFARRLARRSDDNSLPMIERRFETDERFRRQAERYIRDFESLLDQASNCDPENVLSHDLPDGRRRQALPACSRARWGGRRSRDRPALSRRARPEKHSPVGAPRIDCRDAADHHRHRRSPAARPSEDPDGAAALPLAARPGRAAGARRSSP